MAKRKRGNGQGTLVQRAKGGPWTIVWYDHSGKRKYRSTRTTDKRAAERILAKHVADTALRKEGVIDARLDALGEQGRRPIDEHVDDFQKKMETAGRAAKHVKTTLQYIKAFIADTGWTSAGQINADDVNRFVGKLREKGRSARTIEAYLTAIKGFTTWLAKHQKLPSDPLAAIQKPNPKADRKRERRMLLPDEWQWLRDVTLQEPERFGMTGSERILLYATALQTGLRQNELRSLTRGRLFLDAEPPYVICKAKATKNAKDARQYIRPELAEALRQHVARRVPGAPVFSMPPFDEVAEMLRADLAEARRQWIKAADGKPKEYQKRIESDFLAEENHEHEHLDFHSLRHTCGAWLAKQGVHPKVVQSVMRHSSITLTMDTYGHLFPGQESDAVLKFDTIMGKSVASLRATGTTDDCSEVPTVVTTTAARSDATCCDAVPSKANRKNKSGDRKSPSNAYICDGMRKGATEDETAPGRTRTCDLLIRSQLLYPSELQALDP